MMREKRCFEVRMCDMSTLVVYAYTEKSAMRQAESIRYQTAVNVRLLSGNKNG